MASYYEVPLKPSQETFYDDPEGLDDISLQEMQFDLAHNIKNINKLHLYHSIFVFEQTLELIIRLQLNPQLCAQFRLSQLQKYEVSSQDSVGSPPIETSLYDIKESTPELMSNVESPPYIPVEELIATTKVLDQSKVQGSLWLERLRKELGHLISHNPQTLKGFNLIKAPNLSIAQFLLRIKTYSPAISVSAYVLAAFLMFKLCILLDTVPLNEYNVHRFILASLRCSTKILEDIYQKQARYATVVGVLSRELFRLEVSFLFLCNFKLAVDEEVLDLFLGGFFVDLVQFCKENLES